MQDTAYFGGLQLSVPVFYGYSIKNAVKKAEAELEVAKANLLLQEENITNEVWNAFYNFKTSDEQLIASKSFLASASESFSVSLARYKAGATDIVELLDAQRTLADARSQIVNAKMDLYNSYAELVHAVGVILPETLPENYEVEMSKIGDNESYEK